jgi:translocation and assembly module TamA
LHCSTISRTRSENASPAVAPLASPLVGLLLGAAVLVRGSLAQAADPQPYSVTIASTRNDLLDSALKESSQLESLRESAPVGPFALVERAREDAVRLKTVLESFGYYQGQVSITVNGKSLDDPELPDVIATLATDRKAGVTIAVEPGQLYRLRKISIDGEVSESERAALGLEPGAPANGIEVLDAQARLLSALQEHGYAFATVDAPVAYEDPVEFALDVTFKVSRGESVVIGEIGITGLKRIQEGFVRKRLLLQSGERYSPSKIEKARRDLLGLGVFSGVTIRTGDRPDASDHVGVIIDLQEHLRHSLGFSTAYSSDLGGSAGVKWSDRNLLGRAEQLNLSAAALELGGHATTGLGYNLAAQLTKPDYGARDQNLQFNVATLKQSLRAYDQTAVTASTVVTRRFTLRWTGGIGISGEREQVTQERVVRDYTLVALPLNAKFNSTGVGNPLEDAVHGMRLAMSITPTRSLSAARGAFVVVQADAAVYLDLATLGWAAPGRSVLAARALVGQARGASSFDLPPDQRFYGGGSGTVRGFRYQSVGPRFPDGNPIGGTAIDAATVEYRQRIAGQFGAAIFLDAGHVSGDGHPLQGRPAVGAGIGMRYYTPIGPVRLDVAIPVTKLPGGDAFELYVGLGQAF